jgi:hypothetical protein
LLCCKYFSLPDIIMSRTFSRWRRWFFHLHKIW